MKDLLKKKRMLERRLKSVAMFHMMAYQVKQELNIVNLQIDILSLMGV